MPGTVYTNFVGTQNRRQYAMTGDEVNAALSSLGVATTLVLSGYVLISSLTATLASYALTSSLASYLQTASLSTAIAAQATHSIVTPSAAGTVVMAFSNTQACYVAVPGSLLPSLTVLLPPSAFNSAKVIMSCTHSISTLAVQSSDGSTVVAAPTSLVFAVNPAFAMIYNAPNNSWYPTT